MRPLDVAQWDTFAHRLQYVPQSAGPEALAAAWRRQRRSSDRTCAGCTT